VGEGLGAHTALGKWETSSFQHSTPNNLYLLRAKAVSAPFPASHRSPRRCRAIQSAAGCKLQFDAATIKPLIQLASTELKKL
jgi:hypothetical protein